MNLKLSAAIRIGAKMNPQGQRRLYSSEHKTCALGAALIGIEITPETIMHESYKLLKPIWPILKNKVVDCPACGYTHEGNGLLDNIWILNDYHDWTREKIADWVETIENKEAVNKLETPSLTI